MKEALAVLSGEKELPTNDLVALVQISLETQQLQDKMAQTLITILTQVNHRLLKKLKEYEEYENLSNQELSDRRNPRDPDDDYDSPMPF